LISIVSVLDDPTLKFELTIFSYHSLSEPDLSKFVVEEDGDVEREGWDSEVGEWNLSGTKTVVKEWDVEEDGDESSLGEKTEVTKHVDHTLLGERKVSGLADHEVSPLDANDGDEVSGLSILKGLSGVADWPSVSDMVELVETWDLIVIWAPSASGPGISTSVHSVPHSNINLTVLGLVPTEDLVSVVPGLSFSGSWIGEGHVSVTINGVVGLSSFKITGSSNSIWVGLSSWSEFSDGGLSWVVHITKIWEWSLQGSESPDGSWSDTEIVEGKEVGIHTSGSLNDTNLEVSEGDKLSVDQVVSLGVSWDSVHDIELWVLIIDGDSWDHVGTEIDTEDEYSGERKWDLEQDEEDEWQDLWDVGGESVGNGFLQVIEDESTFLDTVNDGREVIIEQEHIGSILSNIRSGTHSNTNIGLLNSWGVIDTITGNSDDVSSLLAGIDDKKLLGWSGSGEDDLWLRDPSLEEVTLVWIIFGHTFLSKMLFSEQITVDDDTSGLGPGDILVHTEFLNHVVEFSLWVLDNVDFVSNSSGSWWLITSDHDNFDTGRSALGDGQIDSWSWWIVEGNDTDEAEVVHWEGSWSRAVVAEVLLWVTTPRLPVLDIELVGVFWELVSIKSVSGEGKYSLTHLTELGVGLVDLSSEFFGEVDLLSVDEDSGASGEDSLWGTLHEDAEVVVLWVLGTAHVSDESIEFNVRREWDKALSVLTILVVDEGWGSTSGLVEVHDTLGELDETSLGGITFAVSVDVWHLFLSSDKSGLHLLHVLEWKVDSLEGSDGNLLHSGVELLGLIISWVIVEDGVGTEDNGLNEAPETWVLWIITELKLVIWLWLSLVSEMILVVEGSVEDLSVAEDVGDGHSVLGKSTGLVRADAGGGAEGLDGLEVLDQDHLSGHSLGSEGKRDSDGSEKTLWDVGDDDTNGEHKVGDDVVLINETEDEEDNTEGNGDGRDDSDESFNLNGKWGLGGLSRGGQVSNLTDDGGVTNSEADTGSGTSSALGTEESNVLGLEDVWNCLSIWVDVDIKSLTGEGSVVDFHFVGLEDANIAWDVLTTLDEDDITWDDVLGLDLGLFAISDNVSNWWDEVLELSHHLSGLGGLHVGEDTRKEGNDGKDDTEPQVGSIFLIGLDTVTNEAEEGSEPKEEGEETGELVEEEAVPWDSLLLGESVHTVLRLGSKSCGGSQTGVFVGVEFLGEGFSPDTMIIPSTNGFGT
jgi:hypothetical protein